MRLRKIQLLSSGIFVIPQGCWRGVFAAFIFITAPAFAFDSVQLKKTIAAPTGVKNFTPFGLAVDPGGRMWVSDPENDRLFLYSSEGELVQPVGRRGVGTGELQQPRDLAVDPDGNVYVADSGNQRIQIFSPQGKSLGGFGEKGTEAGQFRSPQFLAISRDGVVAVVDKESPRIQLYSKDGVFLHSIETGASIDGIAIDAAGHLYCSHTKLKLVEQWSAAGQLLRTYAGAEAGVKPFSKPQQMAISGTGLLYVADSGANQFRELDSLGHTLGSFGRSGSGEGQFRSLDGLAVAGDMLYLSDAKNHRLSIFSLSRQTPLTPLTPVAVARVQVNRIGGLATDVDRLAWNPNGTLNALSFARNELLTYDVNGSTVARLDLKAELGIRSPAGIITAPTSGAIFISDAGNDRVVKLDKKGKLLLEFGKSDRLFKSGQGELSKPQGMACSPQGVLFVADSGNNRFEAFNHQALYQFSGGEKGSDRGQLKNPVGIASDKNRVYVADPGNKKVVVFNGSGRFLYETGVLGPETLAEPRQIVVDQEGNFYVLDVARSRVVAFDPQGVYLGGFGGVGRGEGFLFHPRSFALSDTGDLYVAEEGRVQIFHVVLLPPPPTNLSASAGEGYISLKWDAVKTRFPAKYIIYRTSPGTEPLRLKETVETTTTDDTLLADSTYTYTVAAQSVQGATSVPSAPASIAAMTSTSGPRLEIISAQIDDLFSAHYKYYGRRSLGHVLVKNNGLSPVRKIKLTFAIQGYMDYPTEVSIPELHSMEEKDVSLVATFNNRILEVTETTPIQAQLKLIFYTGDKENSVVRHLPFKLYSRNTIRWDNKERLAAWVTPNDPPVIDFARGLAVPFGEAHRGAPLPSALITAWSLFEGLGTYGISYAPRPNNPYDRVSLDSSTVDTLQFARETLARRSGDCADVVVLLASALESMTVATCALDAPGHLFLMFDTGETSASALGFPENWVVLYAGSYWIPLEATMVGSSFLEAWRQGAEEYRRWTQQRKLTPVDIHLAWRNFEPATLPEVAAGSKPPSREAVEQKFLADWKEVVETRWQTSLAEAKKAQAASPASGEPWLRMGFLAVDFRRYEEARDYFSKARTDPKTAAAAFNNLGNLAFLKGDMAAAESLYSDAQQKDPSDPQVFLNLARLYMKLSKPDKASNAFERAVGLDPTLREQYPDVSTLAP